MADFGLYTALNTGRRDWSQVRQDRLLEVQLVKQMQADLENRVAKEAQARAGVVEYMKEIQKASVLSQDLERVQAVEAEERKKIVAGIQKAGNNYQKFLMGDGAAIMNNYYNNVMTSDAMIKAQKNKLNAAQASLDDYLGRWQRPVPDGNGNMIPFKDALAAFQRGETDVLNYGGSVQPLDMVKMQQLIQSTYGKDRNKKQAATKEDLYNYAKRFGAEDWAAQQVAEGYAAGVESGAEPLYFKSDVAPQSTGGISDKTWDRILKMVSGSDNMLYSYMNGQIFDQVANGKPEKSKWGGVDVILKNQRLDANTKERIINMNDLQYDKTDNVYYYIGTGYEKNSGKEVNMSDIDIKPENINGYTIVEDKEGNQQTFLKATVEFGNRDAKKKGIIGAGGSFDNDKLERTTTFDVKGNMVQWMWGGNRIEGDILIPVKYTPYGGAQERYTGTQEERFDEDNMREQYEIQQVIDAMQ